MAWIHRLVERYTETGILTQAPAQKPNVGSVKGVVELLARAAANGLKFPKLWLKFSNGDDLRISIAGNASSTPGYLVLTDGEGFGMNRYYGKISPVGDFQMSSLTSGDSTLRNDLQGLLARLAAEPAKVAAEFGHLTGHCCFCSKKLKDGRSTAVGYGRTCAAKFGMPWGEK